MEARDKILDAALQLFAEAGSRGATTRRIADAAGVNEVTVFRHFGSKERLMREAFLRVSERDEVERLADGPGNTEGELVSWAALRLRDLHLSRVLIRRSMSELEERPDAGACACAGPNRVGEQLRHYVDELQRQGVIACDADTDAAIALLTGAIFADAIGRDLMPEQYPFSIDDAAQRYVRLFLRSITR